MAYANKTAANFAANDRGLDRIWIEDLGENVRIYASPIGSTPISSGPVGEGGSDYRARFDFPKEAVQSLEMRRAANDTFLNELRLTVSFAGAEAHFVFLCSRETYRNLQRALDGNDVPSREVLI